MFYSHRFCPICPLISSVSGETGVGLPVAEGGEDCRVSVGYCELTRRVVHSGTC
jgi:hypothetical protein